MEKMNKRGIFQDGDVVVCTLTGHGLKDAARAIAVSPRPVTVKARLDEVVEVLALDANVRPGA